MAIHWPSCSWIIASFFKFGKFYVIIFLNVFFPCWNAQVTIEYQWREHLLLSYCPISSCKLPLFFLILFFFLSPNFAFSKSQNELDPLHLVCLMLGRSWSLVCECRWGTGVFTHGIFWTYLWLSNLESFMTIALTS